MDKPLAGVRVVDLTQFLAGPFCTMVLADMGADVIKVETPGGEPQRLAMRIKQDEESISFLTLNRNKRGIVLDLTTDEGRELLYELVATADVFVENYRPGVTTKLGIDYDTLREHKPDLIYASITGFGDSGPWAQRPGLDAIAQSMSGLMSVTGYPGSAPVKVGVPATDLTSGLFGAIGILTAYVHRLRTGVGQRVGASLFEAGLALAIHESNEYWSTGNIPGPLGSGHRFAAPYQSLRTQDGYVTVGAGTDKLWGRFCEAIGRNDLLADERFADNNKRMQNIPALVEELEKTLVTEPTDVWVDRIIGVGVPAGPLLNYQQVLEAPHTLARDMVVEYDHPKLGRLKTLGTPFKLSEFPSNGVAPAPMLAQHTDEVLGELGVDPERIAELREKGVL